ncbi:MAG: hypothetical protein K9G60_12055, partial [Pseudolabrys sp.]|nr:hypothetical protein [Pseudolabrys sp.]
ERSAAGAERGWPGEGALPNPENDENPSDPMSSLHADIDPRSSREQDLSPHSSPNGERSLAYAGRGEQAEPPYYPALLPPPVEGDDPAAIVPRLQNAAVRVLPAIEATIARLAAGASHPREMEQAGRALSSLTRTLRELNALLAQHQAHPWSTAGDEIPQDMDAFRAELARRLNAIIDAMAEEREEEAKAQET